jgi:hypothetical protein
MKKTQLFVATLLMMSVIAAGFAIAEDSSTAVSAEVVTEVNADVDELVELDAGAAEDVPSTWKARPAISTTYGQGWNDEGKFANLVVLSKTFVNSGNTAESKTILRGRLVVGDEKYGLRTSSTTSDVMDGTVTFDVFTNKEKTKVGTLTLKVSNQYEDLKIRNGEFIDGSELTIATKTRNIQKPVRVVRDGTVKASGNVNANAEVKNSAEAKEFAVKRAGLGGFLDRIFARKAVAARADIQASQ